MREIADATGSKAETETDIRHNAQRAKVYVWATNDAWLKTTGGLDPYRKARRTRDDTRELWVQEE